MRIGYISESDGGVDYHRLVKPFEHLAQLGHEVTRYNAIPLERVGDVDTDCIIFNRFIAGDEAQLSLF